MDLEKFLDVNFLSPFLKLLTLLSFDVDFTNPLSRRFFSNSFLDTSVLKVLCSDPVSS